jgi:hypothetical protein
MDPRREAAMRKKHIGLHIIYKETVSDRDLKLISLLYDLDFQRGTRPMKSRVIAGTRLLRCPFRFAGEWTD